MFFMNVALIVHRTGTVLKQRNCGLSRCASTCGPYQADQNGPTWYDVGPCRACYINLATR